jgi:hypothetical protein
VHAHAVELVLERRARPIKEAHRVGQHGFAGGVEAFQPERPRGDIAVHGVEMWRRGHQRIGGVAPPDIAKPCKVIAPQQIDALVADPAIRPQEIVRQQFLRSVPDRDLVEQTFLVP